MTIHNGCSYLPDMHLSYFVLLHNNKKPGRKWGANAAEFWLKADLGNYCLTITFIKVVALGIWLSIILCLKSISFLPFHLSQLCFRVSFRTLLYFCCRPLLLLYPNTLLTDLMILQFLKKINLIFGGVMHMIYSNNIVNATYRLPEV